MKPMTQKEAAEKVTGTSFYNQPCRTGKIFAVYMGDVSSFLFSFLREQTKGAEYIKECLKRIIENEDKKNPYSDRVLAAKTAGNGH